ncbi:MAG: LytTR family transcriptional regulator [Runella slithyformis]|nr:MAG: LytTR family transcriptional regulator [Runella slithyformis]TAF23530.1 MAG: LytTR family transcriptional regulator [Runella slithyformis]TAF43594.1 MAG: LytTR family transcriptional regulator [Runella slithyformis]TAF78816.1 MAG: LytTR family transcriptional regulator [Runella slithyformis]
MFYAISTHTQLELDNVCYLKGMGNYTIIVFAKGKQLILAKSLAHLLARLPEAAFLRVSKTYAINVSCLSKISLKSQNAYARINTGEEFEISRRRAAQLRKRKIYWNQFVPLNRMES